MEKEMKETLAKVADYNRMEKAKAARAGNIAFCVTFFVCTAVIVIQLIITGTLLIVLGETAVLLTGGIAYIALMVRGGVWESVPRFGNILLRDFLVSAVFSGIFAVILAAFYIRMGAEIQQAARMASIFFAGIVAVSFAVLRILAYINRKRKGKT